MHARLRWCTWTRVEAVHAGLQTRNSHTLILNIEKQLFHTHVHIILLDVLVLLVVPNSEEFPPILPLQLLLLYPNLPQVLHCLEMTAFLLVSSLGSLAFFFLGLPSGLLLMEG